MTIPDTGARWSGEWHIVNTKTRQSLESWQTERNARYFCDSVNDHENRNGRGTPYAVERHPLNWRKGSTAESV